jgi:hypothetical protein
MGTDVSIIISQTFVQDFSSSCWIILKNRDACSAS